MPKSFTDREKEIIRESLMQSGRELFGTLGLKKTNIQDLTDAAGIAKGSFYNFFDSKEILYYRIIRKEEESLKIELLAPLQDSQPLTRQRFKEFILNAFRIVDQNPIVRRVYLGDEYELLMRKLPQKLWDEHTAEDISEVEPLIRKWQQNGAMVQKDPKIIIGVIRSIFVLAVHKTELGEKYFDRTVELLTECVAAGLIPEETRTDD